MSTTGCRLVAAALGGGLAALSALHLVEPPLALTWSFAHLGRHPALPWVAAALVVALPPATVLAWRWPWLHAPLGRPRAVVVAAAVVAGMLACAVLGLAHPAPSVSVDTDLFALAVEEPGYTVPRWDLTIRLFRLAAWLAPQASIPTLIRSTNGVVAALALAALAACARRLARRRGEAVAIAALTWSAFGVLQLAIGYLDVYPTALLVLALYLWAALAALVGDTHPGWALALAAVGPFFYMGLVLVWPSVLVLVAFVARRQGGWRRLAVGAAVAAGAAGMATLPVHGRPFAWIAFAERLAAASNVAMGLSPTSTLLPPAYLLSATHAREVLHALVLVDGVGVLLIGVTGAWMLARRGADPAALLLASVVVPYLTYLVAFDPIFGMFADWDLFSWGAAATGLLGAYGFVVWGRACPRPFAALLGLALATAGVHLLARLGALDVDAGRHLVESPHHTPPRR